MAQILPKGRNEKRICLLQTEHQIQLCKNITIPLPDRSLKCYVHLPFHPHPKLYHLSPKQITASVSDLVFLTPLFLLHFFSSKMKK